MTRTADAVVVGGGVHGASVLYHLAKKGMKNIILAEQRFLGSGASGKSSALVRFHYTCDGEALLALESWKIFSNWAEIVGGTAGFREIGMVRIVKPTVAEKLKANVANLQKLGVDTHLITAGDLKEIDPWAFVDDIEIAAWEPRAGYGDPSSVWTSFTARAREMGARVEQQTKVEEILVKSGRVTGVVTDKGETIETPNVVVCAGSGSKRLAAQVGIDLPIWPFYILLGYFQKPPEMAGSHHRIYGDAIGGSYFRPEGSELTQVGSVHWDTPVDDAYRAVVTPTMDFISEIGAALAHRIPIMEKSVSRGGDAGIDVMSPDGRPILGKARDTQGFYISTGHSGTGFKVSPASGLCLAEFIAEGRATTVDISPFYPERFMDGKEIHTPLDYRAAGHGHGAEPEDVEHGTAGVRVHAQVRTQS